MTWRIVLALAGLAPAVVAAIRDGRLTEAEARELGAQLLAVVAGLLVPPPSA